MKLQQATSIPNYFSMFTISVALNAIFYFYLDNLFFYFLGFTAVFLFLIPSGFLILGKWWMTFGLVLGKYISPIMIKLLYFSLVAPLFLTLKVLSGVTKKYRKGCWRSVSQKIDFKKEF